MRTRFRDVDLSDYKQIFGAQEVNKRMKDKAAHACHALCGPCSRRNATSEGNGQRRASEVRVGCDRCATILCQGRLAQPRAALAWPASGKLIVLKKANGLAWGIQYACGLTQEPRETISLLRDYVTATSHRVEERKGLAICMPSQSFD